MTKKIRIYSAEFKAEAVKKIADNNGSISATADIIGHIELYDNEERLAKHWFAATQDKRFARSGMRIEKVLGYRSPRQIWSDFYRQAA